MKTWVIGKSSIVAGQLWHYPGGGNVVIPHSCQMGVFHHLAFTDTPRRKDTALLPHPPAPCGLYWYRDGEAVLTAGKSCEPLIPIYPFLTLIHTYTCCLTQHASWHDWLVSKESSCTNMGQSEFFPENGDYRMEKESHPFTMAKAVKMWNLPSVGTKSTAIKTEYEIQTVELRDVENPCF